MNVQDCFNYGGSHIVTITRIFCMENMQVLGVSERLFGRGDFTLGMFTLTI